MILITELVSLYDSLLLLLFFNMEKIVTFLLWVFWFGFFFSTKMGTTINWGIHTETIYFWET